MKLKACCVFAKIRRNVVISLGYVAKIAANEFEPMFAPTKNVLWIEFSAILKRRTALAMR